MSRFDRHEFCKFILDNRVVGFFDEPLLLKSGRKSNWYVNWRTVSNDVFLMDRLAEFLIAFTADNNLKPDAFLGVPEGATKLGVIATYKMVMKSGNISAGSHCIPMGRGEVKSHGAPTDRYFIGEPKGNVVIVEDVTTTGGSLLSTLERLKNASAEVIAAIGLTNRMEKRDDGSSVESAVARAGVKYLAMSEAGEFLSEAVKRFKPSSKVIDNIKEEFKKFGCMELRI